MWKPSIQKYSILCSENVHRNLDRLRDGTFRSDGFNEFDLRERGHLRHIRAVNARERNVQNCLCKNCLIPLMEQSFVFDNSATRTGKGYHFAIRRLRRKLARYIRKHGLYGYIFIYDYKDYFSSIDHGRIKGLIQRRIQDERLLSLIFHFINCFGVRGLGLGSPISQNLSLAAGDRTDHAISELYRLGLSARYMDDGYVLCPSKGYLKACMYAIKNLANAFHLRLNERKTKIIKLCHGFTMLKKRFSFRGKRIIMKICQKSVARERKKLKKLMNKVAAGQLTVKDIYQSYQSWRSYARHGNAYRTIKNMNRFYSNLVFGGPAA